MAKQSVQDLLTILVERSTSTGLIAIIQIYFMYTTKTFKTYFPSQTRSSPGNPEQMMAVAPCPDCQGTFRLSLFSSAIFCSAQLHFVSCTVIL